MSGARWDRDPVAVVLLVVPVAIVLVTGFLTPYAVIDGYHQDVDLYRRTAAAVLAGSPPYRGFPFEYPPLAAVVMAIPGIGGAGDLDAYARRWSVVAAVGVAIAGVILGWLASRLDGRPVRRVLLGWAALVALLAPVLTWRFDIVAVDLALAGTALTIARRPLAGGLALGAGALVKIFPAVFAPTLAGWLWWRGDRRSAAMIVVASGATVLLGLAVTAVIAGAGPSASFVDYQADRLVQLESLAASLVLVGHLLLGTTVTVIHGFGSLQIVGGGTDAILAVASVALVVAVGLAVLAGWWRFRLDRLAGRPTDPGVLLRACLVVGLATILADKVLSAQYVLWALPFALLGSTRSVALALAAAALTVAIFPLAYTELVNLEPWAIVLLASRNIVLIVLLVDALVGLLGRQRADRPAATGPSVVGPSPADSDRTSYTV